jgi:hypothetical protein
MSREISYLMRRFFGMKVINHLTPLSARSEGIGVWVRRAEILQHAVC